MIGLLLLYFAGKAYYDLAKLYGKSQWGFAILGVASYYIGLFAGGFLLGAVLVAMGQETFLMNTNEYLLGLMALPIGILTCWLLYKYLSKRWSNESTQDSSSDELLDDIIKSS